MKQLFKITFFFLAIISFISCDRNPSNSFTMKGYLEGIEEGRIILSKLFTSEEVGDTFIIRDGKFVITKNIPEPARYKIELEGTQETRIFFAENCSMTIKGHADSLFKAEITGSPTNADERKFLAKLDSIRRDPRLDSLFAELGSPSLSEARRAEIDVLMHELIPVVDTASNQLPQKFIKEYPTSYFSKFLGQNLAKGYNVEDIEKLIKFRPGFGFIVKRGDPVPDFKMTLTNGEVVSSADFRGKVVFLEFTATWCKPCRAEMPFIERDIWQKHKSNPKFLLYGIDIKENDLEEANKFIKTMKITYPLAMDPDAEIFKLFAKLEAGVTRNVVLDSNGKIAYLTTQNSPEEFQETIQIIEKLLKE